MRRVTMTDVATRAGVSKATVSYVLNGQADAQSIPASTAARVLRVARDLAYTGNATARALRTQRTHMIGLVADQVATTPYAGAMISGIRKYAWEHGYVPLVVDTDGDRQLEASAMSDLVTRQVDGIIYATMYTHEVAAPAPASRGLPLVLANCFLPEDQQSADVPMVIPAEFTGGSAAAAIVIEQGHRRIGFAGGDPGVWAYGERERGFRAAMAQAGIPVREDLVLRAHADPLHGRRLALDMLDMGATAIVCGNDRMATGAYQAALERGLSIPADVSVVGYDDQESAQFMFPPLTTVRLPHEDIGRVACALLLGALQGDGHLSLAGERAGVEVPCEPVIRQSVQPPRPRDVTRA